MRPTLVLAVHVFALGVVACNPTPARMSTGLLVEKNTQALGGHDALARVESVWRQRNANTFTLRQRPAKHLVVLLNDAGGVRYAEGFDGATAWEILDDGPKLEVSERATVALWHVTQFPNELSPLSELEARGHTLEYLGPDSVDGTAYDKLLLTLSDGFAREYFLNAATFKIERARDFRRFHAYEDEVQPLESIWDDFRDVEGVQIPFFSGERNFETGEQLYGSTMRQVRLNVLMPDAVFSPDGSLEPFLTFIRATRN